MPMLDIFGQNAFSVLSLTDAINKVPFTPGRAGQVVDWAERGVSTLSIAIEEKEGALQLINPTPRGGPGETRGKDKRTVRQLTVPHYQIDDTIMADEVQGVRAFGQESAVQTVFGLVNDRMAEHVRESFDPTLEYQRIGALKGVILNGDGSTLYNLFTEFSVSPPSTVDFSFSPTSSDGGIRTKCTGVIRTIANALGAQMFTGVHAFCGDEFWDDLIASKEVRETYLNQQEARELRGGVAWDSLSYGGVLFENYRGSVGGSPFINEDECRFFPVGVPGLFRTVYAPADYIETVNTMGLPRYAKQIRMPNDKGIEIEMQSNALSYCTRPAVLIRGTNGSA